MYTRVDYGLAVFDVATQLGNFFATRRRDENRVSGEGGKGMACRVVLGRAS